MPDGGGELSALQAPHEIQAQQQEEEEEQDGASSMALQAAASPNCSVCVTTVALLPWFQASYQASLGACPRAELTSELFAILQ